MVRHVVLLEFDRATSEDHLERVMTELRNLPAQIPSIQAYTVGRDLGMARDNATLCAIADFADRTGYESYRDHPAHRSVIDELIGPHLTSRRAIQFELP